LRGAVAAPAGRLEGSGSLTIADGALDFAFGAPAIDLAAPPFATALGGRLVGRLAAKGEVGGTLEAPSLSVDLSGVGVEVAGEPLPPDQPLELAAELAGGRLAVEGSLGDLVTLSGGGPLAADGTARLEIDLATDRLSRWVALASGAPVAEVEGSARGILRVTSEASGRFAAALELPTLELQIAQRALRALEPVEISWDGGGDLEIDSVYLGDPQGGDELFVAGRVLLDDGPRLDLRVQASVGAAVLRPFIGGRDVEGQLDLLAVVRGHATQPELNGQASLAEGRWIPEGVPHSFERVRGLALFYPQAVVLDRLEGRFAGGSVTLAGRVDRPVSEDLKYRFEMTADGVTLRYPAGWLLRGGGDFSLASTPEGRLLRGELRLDRAFYLQDLALSPAQLIQRLLTRGRVEEVSTDDLAATTSLGLVVRAPDALRIRNNVARLGGGGELTVRGSLARPVVFGEIVLDPGGTVDYGGNEYELSRARVLFANPARIEPVLDVVANSRISPYVVSVVIDGPLSKLSTTFTSDPPLPDLDVLGLIATGSPLDPGAVSGTGPSAAAPGGTTDTSQAAETLLYGQAASLLSSRVNRLFGLDTLRIDPLTVGDSVSAARVTVGKRVSRQLFVTYSYDPSTTAQSILQVEWRLTDTLTLVLTQNGNESYAVDARWESRF
ncbi:MAG: translocation/assembly module TamB domain-containing protein, partial [Acidobacteria bacterium]|nr:translocation/assembly module TamB domain-containing protein [Acidobacteriota bacterium]